MMTRKRLSIVIGLVLAFTSGAPALAKRVALVIGNDNYQQIGTLQKAIADATSYADLLSAQGFTVSLKTDLSRDQMDQAIAAFTEVVEPGDTAVFVYSGHGWSDGTQNYLVGVDVPAQGSQDYLTRLSIPLQNGTSGVLDALEEKGASLKVAIIDACRENPFRTSNGSRGFGLPKGLAPVQAGKGTFIVFSAGAGETALDRLSDSDEERNSVFSREFIPLLARNMSLLEAIKTAQQKVAALARTVGHDQHPAYYDEVIGFACLSARCRGVPQEQEPAPQQASAEDPVTVVKAFYLALSQADGEAAAALVVPQARGLPAFLPENITRFYSSLPVPLNLRSVSKVADDVVVVGYSYVKPNGASCRATATVTTTEVDGQTLISHIATNC